MSEQVDGILRAVSENGVRTIQLWFSDIVGTAKSIALTPVELETAIYEGMSFDGSAIEGFSRVQESDMLARPDITTFRILPWQENGAAVARLFCDIETLDGVPFEGDPRRVLRHAVERAKSMGFSCSVAPEIEYFYFASSSTISKPVPLDANGYFDYDIANRGGLLRRETVHAIEDLGIPVEYSQHEDSPSQHEIDLRNTDALTMADSITAVRLLVKGLASKAGLYATFMPKPLDNMQGSGMHTHFSLFEGDKNVFFDDSNKDSLSAMGRSFIAGVLHHAREMSAVTNQWINSFKRLGNFEAPKYCAWARNNRSVIVNVPSAKRASSTRIEFRAPDPATNPYLCIALVLCAGLNGIEFGYDLPDEVRENLYEFTKTELVASGISTLPSTLSQAIDEMEQSEFMSSVLGEHVFEWYVRNKRDEWKAYEHQVSQFEIERYLPKL